MRFSVDHSTFAGALQHVVRAVPARTTLPVLSGIMLQASNSSITMTATDLEMGIETSVPASVEADGGIVLPARYLGDLVRHIPGGLMDFAANEAETGVTVRWGRCQFTINGQPPEQFPSLPVPQPKAEITLPWEDLATVLDSTLCAVSHDEVRVILTGVHLTVGNGKLQGISTDGFRIAYRSVDVPAGQELVSMVIPGKNVSELLRLPAPETVRLIASDNQAFFDLGNLRFVSRLLDGAYPPVLDLIPRQYPVRIRADREELRAVCERVSVCSDPRDKVPALTLSWDADTLTVTASSATVGTAREDLSVQAEGEPFSIIFNARYLIDGLKNTRAGEVVLEFSGPLTAARITAPDDEGFFYILMPMKPSEGTP